MIVETPRLALRLMIEDDAGFMLRLLNEPSFLHYIGDRGVRTIEDARRYILDGPIRSYRDHGFGMFATELRDAHVPIGICGLLKRDWLDEVDLGFAFLPEYWARGYAFEAASAVVKYARRTHRITRLLAITSHDNAPSQRLLAKLGFTRQANRVVPGEAEEVCVFGLRVPRVREWKVAAWHDA